MYKNRIIYGLDKIHYGKDDKIKPINGALSVEVNFNQSSKIFKINGYNAISFNGASVGTGKLTVLGLTLEEEADLFGFNYNDGEFYIGESVNPSPVPLLFARQKADGGELYSVVYRCLFKNNSHNGETTKEEIQEGSKVLEFDVFMDLEKGLNFYCLDTSNPNSPKEKINNFFEEIQYPKGF